MWHVGACVREIHVHVQAVSFEMPPLLESKDVGTVGYLSAIPNAAGVHLVQRKFSTPKACKQRQKGKSKEAGQAPMLEVIGMQVTMRSADWLDPAYSFKVAYVKIGFESSLNSTKFHKTFKQDHSRCCHPVPGY